MTIAKLCRRQIHHAEPGETVRAAAERMRENNVGTLLVLGAGRKPVGILTDRDLALRVLAERRDPSATRVADVMTSHPRVLTPETSFDEALAAMSKLGVRRMPVVGPQGEAWGMLSADDLLAKIARALDDLGEVLGHSAPGIALPAAAARPRARRKAPSAGLERASPDLEC